MGKVQVFFIGLVVGIILVCGVGYYLFSGYDNNTKATLFDLNSSIRKLTDETGKSNKLITDLQLENSKLGEYKQQYESIQSKLIRVSGELKTYQLRFQSEIDSSRSEISGIIDIQLDSARSLRESINFLKTLGGTE